MPDLKMPAGSTMEDMVFTLERRVELLEAALRDLYRECVEAGHDRDKYYNWPTVMSAAQFALQPTTPITD